MESLKEIVYLQLTAFPQAIVPNKLLQEISSLAKAAKIDLPIVDELAADIFMGSFTYKFLRAAQISATALESSIYANYYSIDFDELQNIPAPSTSKRKSQAPTVCDEFANICRRRAMLLGRSSGVAANGTVIEQQQILTTQNLGTLVTQLELQERLQAPLPDMSRRCFAWICQQLQIVDPTFHSRLIKVKNSAYAWRQMIFYLSLLPTNEVDVFMAWAEEHLSSQSAAFQQEFSFAFKGLQEAKASSLTNDSKPSGFEPYVGWSTGQHPLLKSRS